MIRSQADRSGGAVGGSEDLVSHGKPPFEAGPGRSLPCLPGPLQNASEVVRSGRRERVVEPRGEESVEIVALRHPDGPSAIGSGGAGIRVECGTERLGRPMET